MFDAIILAGGENNKRLCHSSPQPFEALIDIAGKPMVTFVAKALADSGQIDRLFILGPVEVLRGCEFPPNTHLVPSGPTIIETIRMGMQVLGHSNKVLVATADIPLLTADAVNDFLAQCAKVDAELYYPIVPKQVNERRYPGAKRTYVRLREGVFTGGNLFLVQPTIVDRCAVVAERMIENRKRPLKLCQMLGWSFVLRFLTGTLTLKDAERRAAEVLGVTGTVIQSHYPELGIDVDKPSDLELVKAAFAE